MRRSLLALALAALLASPAAAQITPYAAGPTNQSSLALIAPTAPTAANNNQIATTAWVNNFVNAGLPLASGKIWIGSVGNIAVAQTPSGDLTVSNGGVFTFGTVNANVGSFGSVTQCASVTVNAKGLVTAASQNVCTPAIASVTGLGTGVATALAVNVGSAGAFVTFNGAGGTPSSLVLTNATGLPVGSITGAGAGCITWLTTPSSANLRGCVTDETGTGLAYFQGGDIGTPSAGVGTNFTGTAAGLTAGGLADPSASTPFGYATGSGGTVTQLTSRTTGVTLNRPTGAITLFSVANNNAAWTTFTVTNSTVAANDNVVVNCRSSTDTLIAHVTKVSAGSFQITFISVLGTTVESPVIGFSVIRGSNT